MEPSLRAICLDMFCQDWDKIGVTKVLPSFIQQYKEMATNFYTYHLDLLDKQIWQEIISKV